METIYLSGADDVRTAGNRIAEAAAEMKRAAGSIDDSSRQFLQQLDMRLDRLETLLYTLGALGTVVRHTTPPKE